MKRLSLLTLLLGSLLIASGFSPGERFTPTTLSDQFDRNQTITPDTRLIIVVFDKAGYYDVTELIRSKGTDYLQRNSIAFINDISQMPSSILEYFVKPAMQEKPYPILLLKNEKDSLGLNYSDDMITIYTLKKGKINKIEYADKDTLAKYLPKQ